MNGAQRVFVKGGWNRWAHPKHFGPLELTPPGPGGEHHSVTVDVPANCYKMDFVLSDVPEGEGRYDNNSGFDYHLPVEGSVVGLNTNSRELQSRKHDFADVNYI